MYRLVELVEAEKKIKNEAIERAVLAEQKLLEKRGFYRIIKNWWSGFNLELAQMTNQTVELNYRWPTEAEMEADREEHECEKFGERLRQQNDFTFKATAYK